MPTHYELINLGEALGYSGIENGLCAGFTGMWMQAVFAQDEKSFYHRLKLIDEHQGDPQKLVEKIRAVQEKIKSCPADYRKASGEIDFDRLFSDPLEKENALQLLEILAFYDGISLYLLPHHHAELFAIPEITQSYLTSIFSMAQSQQLEERQLEKLLDKNACFQQEELLKFIKDLEQIFQKQTTPGQSPIMFNSFLHTVCLKYNAEDKENPWEFLDIAYLDKNNPDISYRCNSQELAEALWRSLAYAPTIQNEYLAFNARVYGQQDNVELKNKLEEVNHHHPTKTDNLMKVDTLSGSTLLHIILQNTPSPPQNVSELNKLLEKLTLAEKSTLLKIKTVTGWTPLGVAVVFWPDAVAALLVSISGLDDAKKKEIFLAEDAQGWNALHIAAWKRGDSIQFLLASLTNEADKKALLMSKNLPGFDALETALVNNNSAAVYILLNEMAKLEISIAPRPSFLTFLENTDSKSLLEDLNPQALDIAVNALFLEKKQEKLQALNSLIPSLDYLKLPLRTQYIMTCQKDCPQDRKQTFLNNLKNTLQENEKDLPIKKEIKNLLHKQMFRSTYKKAAVMDVYNALEDKVRQRLPNGSIEQLNQVITEEIKQHLKDKTSKLYQAFNTGPLDSSARANFEKKAKILKVFKNKLAKLQAPSEIEINPLRQL